MGGRSSIYVTTLQSLVAVGTVDIMILVWHMISKGHVIKGSCEFVERSPSRYVAILPILVAIDIAVVGISRF